MRFIALSVLCVLQICVSTEKIPDKEKNQKENDNIWEEYGWLTKEATVKLAIVVGGIGVAATALGLTVGGVSKDTVVTWIQSIFFGGTLGNIFAGILSCGAVVLVVSARAITSIIAVLEAGVRNILNKYNSSNDSNCSKHPSGHSAVDMRSETSKKIDSGNCEILLKDIKNLSDTTSDAGEKVTAEKMVEILKLLEDIDESLGNEDK